MKKLRFFLTGLFLLTCSVLYADFEVNGIWYTPTYSSEYANHAVEVRGPAYGRSYSGHFEIPESVIYDGIKYTVIGIYDGTFRDAYDLISVTIPNSVIQIGEDAFNGCANLSSVSIGKNVKSIDEGAFVGCSKLTSIELPEAVTSIGKLAFSGCESLASISIGKSVTKIGSDAFINTAWLNNQSDGVVYLGNVLLMYKGNMPQNTSVDILDGTVHIATNAFEFCTGLTSIEIPNSVISIGTDAFKGCSGLTYVNIEDLVAWCKISFGSDVANPVAYADNLYLNGEKVTDLVIPDGITSIGNYAFDSCGGLTSVEIPNSVTSIGKWAFYYCSGLTSVEIGNNVTSIGNYAFYNCNNLKSVTSLNPTPPATSSSSFSNYDATLYVPFGAKTAYSKANNWKNFTNIEELEPSIYEITDGEEYTEASVKTVNALTYTRTLPNLHWNALYVPFELPYDVIADRYDVAYINDVNGYDTDDNGTIDDLAMEIIKIKGGTLKANYPYLIKAKTEADKTMTITVEDATLYAAEENAVDCSSVYQNYVVKGTYTKKTAEELAGKLAISTSGAWQPLAEGTALNPFRLYLSIENRDNSPLKVEPAALSRMRIVERGETTGIEEVVPSQQRKGIIFDVSGRRVKQPVKGGVYIVNGKKRIL